MVPSEAILEDFPGDIWWVQYASPISGDHNFAAAGTSVAYNDAGDIMAVGMPGHDLNGSIRTGLVRVYNLQDDEWEQYGSDITGAGGFGASVDLSSDGHTLVVGSPGAVDRTGLVASFRYERDQWSLLGSQVLFGQNIGDSCGFAVACADDGLTIAIGCPGLLNDQPGYVMIYDYNGVWTKLGPEIWGSLDGSLSGYSVALSGDGTILAIGAPGTDGDASDTGLVRVYSYDASEGWISMGRSLTGYDRNDLCGFSVDISRDGRRLVYGCPGASIGLNLFAGRLVIADFDPVDKMWLPHATDTLRGDGVKFQTGRSVALSRDGQVVTWTGAVATASQDAYPGIFCRRYDASTDGRASWEPYGSFVQTGSFEDHLAVDTNSDGSLVVIGVVGSIPQGYAVTYHVLPLEDDFEFFTPHHNT
jgi:hypothetical protein